MTTVEVEWMDGEVRDYENVTAWDVGRDHILRLYGREGHDDRAKLVELPTYHIREIRPVRRA